ncbi:hypothetical protein [Rhodococcoides corynebacterioides]|uniref:hypothetical protein n=1 Tax=Rhodococcoides corynebacterioides TaxID=53972 RepID=UPI000833CB8E|nr:hypothetical protein [Rhodococcus corynebacterioides]
MTGHRTDDAHPGCDERQGDQHEWIAEPRQGREHHESGDDGDGTGFRGASRPESLYERGDDSAGGEQHGHLGDGSGSGERRRPPPDELQLQHFFPHDNGSAHTARAPADIQPPLP